MDDETLMENLSHYRFFQTVDLGNGLKTPGHPVTDKQERVLELIGGMDLTGRRVLDIGCANGLFSFEAEKRGAAEVLAIDNTNQCIEALEKYIIPHLDSKVMAKTMNVFDLNSEQSGKFDVVIFSGVLYHLKYPFLALKILKEMCAEGATMILETGIYDDFGRRAMLYCPAPANSPQKSRGGNSCTYFNERAMRENLAFFGFQLQSTTVFTKPLRRALKRVAGALLPAYQPLTNVLFHCVRDRALDNEFLIEFYDSTTK